MTRDAADWKYWVAFQQTPSFGPSRVRALREHFGDDLEAAWRAPVTMLRRVLSERSVDAMVSTRATLDLDALVARIAQADADVLTLADPRYPALLKEVATPPTVLYMRGKLLDEDAASVAIVGTRRVTDYGREVTRRLAGDLAGAGVTIVSGLAAGVDGVAHAAAMDAGGRTIGVLGCGIDRMYPAAHRALGVRMLEHGAILSEHPPGVAPDARFFPARNRIVAGMTLGTIVVEAPLKSGALITSQMAGEYGRDVFAVPGNVFSDASAGCHELLRQGAILTANAEDVLRGLRLGNIPEQRAVQQALPLDPDERRLLELLTHEPRHIDDIAEDAGRAISEVATTLLMMELQGLVRNAGAQQYARAR